MMERNRLALLCPMSSPTPLPPAAPAGAAPGPFSGAAYGAHLLLSALVPPVLFGLIAARAVANGFRQAGLMGEQFIQGQRLPHLPGPRRE